MRSINLAVAFMMPVFFVFLLLATGNDTKKIQATEAAIVQPGSYDGSIAPVTTVSSVNLSAANPVSTTKTMPWDTIKLDSGKLSNNVWGIGEGESLTSGVYQNEDSCFGWYWDRGEPQLKTGDVCVKPIYPSVRIGGSPWENSNTPYFPIKVGDIYSLKFDVAFSYPTAPTGAYNLSYDFFLMDTDQPSAHPDRKAEIMVWLQQNSFAQPADTYKGDISDGYNTYGIYSWTMSDGRLYYSFILKGEQSRNSTQTVDAGKLIENLGLNPDWYIHGIELGNEVVNGLGKIEISNFTVTVNDHLLQN
jgi:hypothetical protein